MSNHSAPPKTSSNVPEIPERSALRLLKLWLAARLIYWGMSLLGDCLVRRRMAWVIDLTSRGM